MSGGNVERETMCNLREDRVKMGLREGIKNTSL